MEQIVNVNNNNVKQQTPIKEIDWTEEIQK